LHGRQAADHCLAPPEQTSRYAPTSAWLAIVIAVIAILSEKIGAFLIYKFNVDIFLSAIIDVVLSTITKSRNK
jgi:hypothetical protein